MGKTTATRATMDRARGPRASCLPPRAAPSAVMLALVVAFGAPATAQAEAGAPTVVHGGATFTRTGSLLLVTTANGTGSNHSAIDWQSFSVPAGSTTRFLQPSAGSTSINRVLSSSPSAILGTLSSNGRLVLVNPAGIAVGAGATVDTAGFTASTLHMTQADAVAGRLAFGDGASAPLRVDGTVVGRGGDVVLIAPKVEAGAQALIQSDGATLLVAGRQVEITGRGLEGIRLHVQAPQDQAVNLGQLTGDAVGIFAGTLRHSGQVVARAVSEQGGRVLLRSTEDAAVSGQVTALANGGSAGSIEVHARRIVGGGTFTAPRGRIRLEAAGDVVAGVLDASGLDGSGGSGGSIEVLSREGSIALASARARGHSTPDGGGNGGTIAIDAHGAIRIGAQDGTGGTGGIDASGSAGAAVLAGGNGGTIRVASATGEVALDGAGASIRANGGSGSPSGNGGRIAVTAGGGIAAHAIEATGGSAEEFPGTIGGAGGELQLRFDGELAVEAVLAHGGDGARGSYTDFGVGGFAGGTGGRIVLERAAGDFHLGDATTLRADGGGGGSFGMYGQGAGAGGDGGSIDLVAEAGSIFLGSPRIATGGGMGGGTGDDPGEPYTTGRNGAWGRFSATARTVELTGTLHLPYFELWKNTSLVNIHPTGKVDGEGAFHNEGEINLHGGASLGGYRAVWNPATDLKHENHGRITVLGPNATTQLEINRGQLVVLPGATLAAEELRFNHGHLQVDGKLDIGMTCDWCVEGFDGWVSYRLNNAAGGLITGTGTIMVDKLAGPGTGWIYNHGTIAPGGQGKVGKLTIHGHVQLESDSRVGLDFGPAGHDLLEVSGRVVTGGTVAVDYLPGTWFTRGDAFRVIRSGGLDATHPPALSAPGLRIEADPRDLKLVATSDHGTRPAPTPAPTPAPGPGPAPGPVTQDQSAAAHEITNQVVGFDRWFATQGADGDATARGRGDDVIQLPEGSCRR